ncbi:MAG: hypothetical protein QOG09_338 [Solirubrobacterales bacterium]|jgi:catechol 2,3-dioxygenase-like lactoylglutathione lyase family enzyme|nr:hypothetical protein [Solirubrobacterales bacterium]MDX6651953.1 hypothetical protein [Solirubrobacterales bacterium]MDX6662236.1 hypothetical protein [Solirubrobacterales bacterium]
MLHHVTFEVSDIERSGTFYDGLLRPLGWRRQIDTDTDKAWGIVKPVFFIELETKASANGALVCFSASGIVAVKASWQAGIDAGGSDDGAPAQRPERGGAYYSALLRDPDGNRVEVAVGPD